METTGGSSESPPEPKKGKSKTPRKAKESVLKQKSPAEFFAENKNIAGFDNPGKCLYTTVRELVENSLDSAESISELPVVEVTIEEIGKSKYNSMIGLVDRERVDEALYDDYETAKAREKRLSKQARAQEIQTKNASLGKKVKEPPVSKGMKGRAEASFYKVTCKDNGRGMPHDDIPNMFGRVLSGTKYGLKQTRGKFGLGAKMALIWSKMSTGLPIEILSSMKGQNYVSFCRLDIDIHRNIPHIHVHEKRDSKVRWHGAEIQVVIEGNWTTYRSKILHYMRQIAVITPYAQFLFKFVSDVPEKNVTIRFARRTDVMPPVPLETKHHPSSVDLLLIKRLITETSKQNLLQFLQHEFVNIPKSYAERLIGEMGPEFSPKMAAKSLTSQQIVRIHQLFRQAKFDDPSGDCLSPAGEYNLRLGIIKELHPDIVATYSGSAQVFEGHPFIVEAGVSVGGKDVKHGLNIFRFANRIPLLFEQGADVVTRTALKRINWSSYKINHTQDKIGVFVSVVSTKIPFKGTGKEYIGDDISEIATAVKSAIQQCCIQLKSKIMKKMQAREQQERKRNLNRYIPDATGAVFDVLKDMAQSHVSKKKRYDDEDADTFIVFRSLTPLLVAIADTTFRKQPCPSKLTFVALLIILGGAVGYVATDSGFTLTAYSWAFAYLVTITTEMVYIKHMVTNLGLNTWGFVLYNNLLSLMMAPVFWFLTGEYVDVFAALGANSGNWYEPVAFSAVSLSCVFGLAISFFGFAARKAISATAFTVTGVVNKFLTVAINVTIWDKHASPFGLLCLLFTLAGGVLYQQSVTRASSAPSQRESTASSKQTDSENDADDFGDENQGKGVSGKLASV